MPLWAQDLVVANSAAVLFQHPYTVLLALINGADSVAVSEDFHVQIRKCLMASVILRAHETVELVVIQIHQPFLELRALGFAPCLDSVSDFINLGVGKLYRLVVRHLYVVSVVILAD